MMTHLVEVKGDADEGVMSRSGTIHCHSFQTRSLSGLLYVTDNMVEY